MNRKDYCRAIRQLSIFYTPYWVGDVLYVGNASTWEFNELRNIAQLFGTDLINIEHEGAGCDTCGHGATISIHGFTVED